MGVPKRRVSKARKRKRRTHQGVKLSVVPRLPKVRAPASRSQRFFCSNCNQPKEPHVICPNCGYYRGRPAVELER